MNKLLYVGEDIGVKNTAMFIHAKNVAELLSDAGFEVSILCTYTEEQVSDSPIKYYYTKPSQSIFMHRLEEMFGLKLWYKFVECVKEIKPDIVLFYGYSAENSIISFCKKNSIKVYIERVDWFSKSDRCGLYAKYFFQKKVDYTIERIDKKANGVVVISKYLFDYYNKLGVNVFRLPPIFNSIPNDAFFVESNYINIIYAGSLNGNKDIIFPFIKCIDEFNTNITERYRFTVIGKIEDSQRELFINKNNGIEYCGELDHKDVVEKMKKAHFGVLLREKKRYAKAGFSTKFAEMMSYGLPMICTRVGGADLLIQDGDNGFLLPDNSEEEIMSLLIRLAKIDSNRIKKMKINAQKTAESNFLASKYINSFSKFLRNYD